MAEEVAISRPKIEVPAKPRPPAHTEAPRIISRQGLRNADLEKLAALMRGGASWDDARTVIRDVAPRIVESFKAVVIERAAQPGLATTFPTPLSAEGEEARLDKWVEAQRAGRKGRT